MLINFLLTFAFLLAIIVLWSLLKSLVRTDPERIIVYSETGVWDLRAFQNWQNTYFLTGPVEYIPNALLDPSEFSAREGEAVIGYPQDHSQYATSRMRILLPDNGYYAFHGRSIDFAQKLYVNGELAQEMGSPGETRKTSRPDTGSIILTLKAEAAPQGLDRSAPEGGVLELIQQASNFVHRDGGGHSRWNIKKHDPRPALANLLLESMKLGPFLSLFFVHIFLFLLLRRFRGNLYFALLCLVWFMRSGLTGTKIFTQVFPWLPWEIKFRMEYLSIPVTAVLLVSLLDVLFPEILQKTFRYALYAVSLVVTVIFLVKDTLFMSNALLWCEAVYIPAIVYIIIRFAMKLRRLYLEHNIFLAGIGVFLLSAIYDIMYSNDFFGLISNIYLPYDLTSVSMLMLAFCQAAAVLIVTVKMMNEAAAENAVLKEKARMMEQQLSLQRGRFSEIMELVNKDVKARHDLRNHLAVMKSYNSLGENAKLDAYMDELSEGMPSPHARKFCENFAVNAIAAYFLGLAENEGITIEARLDIPEDSGSTPAVDLCIIVGNVLEKALDNCRRSMGGNKYIGISSQINGSSLCIEIINSTDGQRQIENSAGHKEPISAEDAWLSAVKAVCLKHRGVLEHDSSGETWKVTAKVQVKKTKEVPGGDAIDLEAIFRKYELSKREMEVAFLLVKEGLSAKEIGIRLFISTYTVNDHIANIYQKFNVKSRGALMALFMKMEQGEMMNE